MFSQRYWYKNYDIICTDINHALSVHFWEKKIKGKLIWRVVVSKAFAICTYLLLILWLDFIPFGHLYLSWFLMKMVHTITIVHLWLIMVMPNFLYPRNRNCKKINSFSKFLLIFIERNVCLRFMIFLCTQLKNY